MKTALILVLAAGAASADPVIYDNGPWTGENLLSSQLDSSLPLDSAVADDFVLGDNYLVTDAHWVGGYYNGSYVAADWRVTIYEDTGAGPGVVIYSEDMAFAGLNEQLVGYDNNGAANYSYDATFAAPLALAAGTYWISFQGMNDYPPQSAVSGTTAVNNSEGYFMSNYFGFPNWVPGSSVFGVGYDIPFSITGVIPAPASIALLGLGALLRRR